MDGDSYGGPILLREGYYMTDENHNHIDVPINTLIDEASQRAKEVQRALYINEVE